MGIFFEWNALYLHSTLLGVCSLSPFVGVRRLLDAEVARKKLMERTSILMNIIVYVYYNKIEIVDRKKKENHVI